MRLEVSNRQTALKCRSADVRGILKRVLRAEGKDAQLSVALVDDQQMRRLNARFLGKDSTTDVLSFPYAEQADLVDGEIVVNAELAVREAGDRPHSAEDELMLYLVHGLLHLLGYNDIEPDDARRMRERQLAILKAAGRSVEF